MSKTIENPKNPTERYSYDFNGVTITDEYAWLESNNKERLDFWLKEQNQLSDEYFSQDSFAQLAEEESSASPINHYIWGQQYAYFYYFAIAADASNQPWQLARYNSISHDWQSYDLNLNRNQTALSFHLSQDGRFVAVLIKSHPLHFQWRIFDTANNAYFKRQLPILSGATNFQWLDKNTFLYSNDQQIKLADIYSSPNLDSVLFEVNNESKKNEQDSAEQKQADSALSAMLTEDYKHLVIQAKTHQGRDKFWVKSLEQKDTAAQLIIENFNADFQFLAASNSKLYFLTNLAASKNRIISIDLKASARRDWKEVLPQNYHLLINAKKVNHQWVLLYKENSRARLYTASLNGQNLKPIALESGSDYSLLNDTPLTIKSARNSLLAIRSNLLNTSELVKLELANHSVSEVASNKELFKLSNFELDSQIHFFRSDDASRIPLTLYAQSKIKRNAPTLMLANNGDGSLFSNQYDSVISNFIRAGGQIAVVHARGGATYGNNWYHAATGKNREKIAEDLLAAQNWLFDKNYTNPDKLAIYATRQNASSFALYLSQPKAAFKAAIFNAGDFDLIAKAKDLNESATDKRWQQSYDYNASEKSTELLVSLNPVANIKLKHYPATMLVTKQNQLDDLKFLAKLQNHQASDQPIIWLDASNIEKPSKVLYFLKQQLKL